MRFTPPLIEGRLIRRYKRFLADIELANGECITAHTPNTGAMLGCQIPGSRVWFSRSANTARKYPYSWELVEARPGVVVGINTAISNRLVEEAIGAGVITELQGYDRLRREVRYGREGSRIDLLLEHGRQPPCYVEVKNVTAILADGAVIFPDAVSARGSKHLRELMAVVEAGQRGVIVYCVQRCDGHVLRPADQIDPVYGATLRAAIDRGVEALAYQAEVTPQDIRLTHSLPVCCPEGGRAQ